MGKQLAAPRRASARPAVPWSEEREAVFLATLAQTASVRNATRASGLSSATIYRRREASDTFRAAWAAALREGYAATCPASTAAVRPRRVYGWRRRGSGRGGGARRPA